MPAILEHPEVLAVGLHIDPEKVTHHAAVEATAARKNHHGSVAIGQAAAVKAVKQCRDVRDITDLLAQCSRANLLLENSAHPLERNLTRLLTLVRFRGDTDDPIGIAKELFYAVARNDRWIGTMSLVGRGRDRAYIIRHGAIAAAKTLRISDTLVDGFDRETDRLRQCSV